MLFRERKYDFKGELLITIMSSLAQEEARSISENCTWEQRKRFSDGKVTVPFKRFLGYDRRPNGELVVNPEQAKIVKCIYAMYLQGKTPHLIAKTLTEEGILSLGGKNHWNQSNITSILTNEKYKGDALLQKSFTVNFLTKEHKINEGEISQYYVKDDHEAIIDPKVGDIVQREMERRKTRPDVTAESVFSPAKSTAENAEQGSAPRSGTPTTNISKSSGNATSTFGKVSPVKTECISLKRS